MVQGHVILRGPVVRLEDFGEEDPVVPPPDKPDAVTDGDHALHPVRRHTVILCLQRGTQICGLYRISESGLPGRDGRDEQEGRQLLLHLAVRRTEPGRGPVNMHPVDAVTCGRVHYPGDRHRTTVFHPHDVAGRGRRTLFHSGIDVGVDIGPGISFTTALLRG